MLNPITYSERILTDFLRYQLTTYPFADPGLYGQMRRLLNLEETRATPLLRGPYVSLSRAFRGGPRVTDLCDAGVLHPHLAQLAPYPRVHGHQETAIRHLAAGRTTLVATGTGSGKTECFLYPIISHCLRLRDEGAPAGIAAVLVYPMNALAEDQLLRLRRLLVGTGITFGMYVGRTPERSADVVGQRLGEGASRHDYDAARARHGVSAVFPPEERVARSEMRTPGQQPRILLTNVKQLELLLTRQQDVELFDGARLDHLVFDEAHTFTGAQGAETACLIRRLRSFCGRNPDETVCVATSATIADPEHGDGGRGFASRFFGVDPDTVALVGEEYEPDLWAAARVASGPFPGDPAVQLQGVLDALSGADRDAATADDVRVLRAAFQGLCGQALDLARWREHLHEQLSANEVVHQIARQLEAPRPLVELTTTLSTHFERPVPEEEIVAWLALGAASRRDDRPLLRPVVHSFVRGVAGAVVSFPDGDGPRLWLSREQAAASSTGAAPLVRLDVTTCTTCGQHYFIHAVADFQYTADAPGGGDAIDDRRVWRPLEEKAGGVRVVLFDDWVATDDDDDDTPLGVAPVFLCRRCGALHPTHRDRCDGCGVPGPLVHLYAAKQKEEQPGRLTRCVSCSAWGRRTLGEYREPARPVRAQNVSDVHVLAQSMIHHAERKRLLVFTDNRQDAAFQAGWMQDHARRFRLRSLMMERVAASPVSVGDLAGHLADLLERDDSLSRSLIPEVWRVERKEQAGLRHAEQRKIFLRAQVLREVTTGLRQRLGLEPWGRVLVEYQGLLPGNDFFARWAPIFGCEPVRLCDGVATLLDQVRRKGVVLDREGQMFSRYWRESDFFIQYGYFPLQPGGPKGLKLRRTSDDEPARALQILSTRGVTTWRQSGKKWGLPDPRAEGFFTELWRLLNEELHLLAPVTLTGRRDFPLPGAVGVTQIDADRLLLHAHRGFLRCGTCRRTHLRATPNLACPTRNCGGTLAPEAENPDDYDLSLLDRRFEMVRAREHSAQVPSDERESLERIFKSDSEDVNTLVCTPTLELGVDIGGLDAVLMRNVPPAPANYRQRTGRAGRRHRMAVNITYARPASHDRAYFDDPLQMLRGPVEPPSFNLKNELMVRKHVHATVVTALHALAAGRGAALPEAAREAIARALETCFPTQVKSFLFDAAEEVRAIRFSTAPLAGAVTEHRAWLLAEVARVFAQGWPEEDSALVRPEALAAHVDGISGALDDVIRRLERRLRWAIEQLDRLDTARRRKGTLDPEEDAVRTRCDRLIKRLKGRDPRRRADTEGYDDTYTFAVLAAEGFLPGYGLETGTVVGYFQAARYRAGTRDWELRRPLPLALREYVPGNLVYANGHRFVPRFFHLEPVQPTLFQVDPGGGAVVEVGAAPQGAGPLGAQLLLAVPMCDLDLPHQSHISDEEDHRFQLSVAVFGHEQPRHAGGRAFRWGGHALSLRSQVHLRLVNVGTASAARGGGDLGYPVCLVCGQSRSALASQAELDSFRTDHLERCGRPPERVGFFAQVVADCLTLQSCTNVAQAHSLAEALRAGAAEILEMDAQDLQVIVLRRPGTAECDAVLYDPMPGGSGLLEQLVARWGEVVNAAHTLADGCPSQCTSACIDCLQTYRNAFVHAHLDRHVAAEALAARGGVLEPAHEIPPMLPRASSQADARPVNAPEQTLRDLLVRAGFQGAIAQHPIDLGLPLGTTTPDFFFEDAGHTEGVCLYLDGMSEALHGNPETHRRDRQIREELRARMFEVIELTATQLTDQGAITTTFRRLARILIGRERAEAIASDPSWFTGAPPPPVGIAEGWDEILALLDAAWHDLALALRNGGIPAPDDADWDLVAGGRVTGSRALLVWRARSPAVALVAAQTPSIDGVTLVVAGDPAETLARVRAALEIVV